MKGAIRNCGQQQRQLRINMPCNLIQKVWQRRSTYKPRSNRNINHSRLNPIDPRLLEYSVTLSDDLQAYCNVWIDRGLFTSPGLNDERNLRLLHGLSDQNDSAHVYLVVRFQSFVLDNILVCKLSTWKSSLCDSGLENVCSSKALILKLHALLISKNIV